MGAVLPFAALAQQDIRLPDLGSSANALISPQEAQDYGDAMLHQMRALDMVVDDPLLDSYINDIGFRLVANSDSPKEHFAFFIAKDPEINAFAMPGGYIGVNSGLIAITRNEDELASVIAHEIGHITQNHLQRSFEDAKKSEPLMALVLLGAIASGASGHGGGSPMAILAGGQGLIAQKSINFTRHDEIEADRVGIQTLAKAGFDPHAMANFFEHMQDVMSADAAGEDDFTLLQSHPVTATRISDAKSRASELITKQKQRPAASSMEKSEWEKFTAPMPFVKDPGALVRGSAVAGQPDTYALMRERAHVLAGEIPKEVSYYATNLRSQPGFDTPATRYGYALALTRDSRGAQAIDQLQPLLQRYPASVVLQLAMAEARLQAGQRAAALAAYANLNTQSPGNRAVILAYATALTVQGDAKQAKQAVDLMRPLLGSAEQPEIYTAYARANEKAGDPVRAEEAFANASYYAGRPFDAMEQLRRILTRNDLDYYAHARIQARIAELTPLVMELRKRRIQTDDSPDGQ